MSSVFEYRRLAAASLGLAKRAVVLTDKMRLLLIAEGWLNLADRTLRNGADGSADATGRHSDSIEQLKSAEHSAVAGTFRSDDTAKSTPTCN